MVLASVCLANRCPVTDALEVFQGDTSSGAFGFRHHLFADAVIHVPCEAGLLEPPLLEQPPARAGPFALKSGPQFCMALSKTIDPGSAVDRPIGVSQNVDNAQVTTQIASHLLGQCRWGFQWLMDEKPAVRIDQQGLRRIPWQLQPRTSGPPYCLSVHPDGVVRPVRVSMEGHRSQRAEIPLYRSVFLVAVSDSTDSYSSLDSGKPESLPKLVVAPSLQWKPVEDAFLEGNVREPVASLIETFHHGEEGLGFLRLCSYHSRELHSPLIIALVCRILKCSTY